MTFLLILSILVNMVSIFAIIILYLRQNRLVNFEKNYRIYMKESEELINTFIFEMKEENQEIKQLIGNQKASKPTGGKTQLNQEPTTTVNHTVTSPPEGYIKKTALNAYGNTSKQTNVTNDLDEKVEIISRTESETDSERLLKVVTEMRNQGKTIEEIAKKMGRGKTEIELLLKLNQK